MAGRVVGAEQLVDERVAFEGGIEDAQRVRGIAHPHGEANGLEEVHGGQQAARIVAQYDGGYVMRFQHAPRDDCFHLVDVFPNDHHGGSHRAKISRTSRHREGDGSTD